MPQKSHLWWQNWEAPAITCPLARGCCILTRRRLYARWRTHCKPLISPAIYRKTPKRISTPSLFLSPRVLIFLSPRVCKTMGEQREQFPRGMQVEVFSDEEGLRGVWFEAAVVRPAAKRHKVYVEYKTLKTSEKDDSKPLREFVNEVNLRPPQPREKDRSFNLNEEVDAYYNDGWWEGVVTQVKDKENFRYMVYFRPSKELLEFGKSDLRIHREWVHGLWKPPMEENHIDTVAVPDTPQPQSQPQPQHKDNKKEKPTGKKKSQSKKSSEMEVKFNDGMVVEVSSDEEGFVGAWFTAKIVKAVGKNKFLVEYDTLRTDDESELLKEEAYYLHIRPPPPEIPQIDSFRKLEEVDAFYNDAWWVGVVSKVLDNSRYYVYFRESHEEIEFDHSQLRFHQDWINKKWVRSSEALML